MTALSLKKDDFKLIKKFPVIPRLITGILLIIIGIITQIFLPNSYGIFPFEEQKINFVSFFLGFFLLIIAVVLLFPERLVISEKPILVDETPFWKDSKMKSLSDVFNYLNNREKKQKSAAAFFDLKKSKGRWIFFAVIVILPLLYFVPLSLADKVSGSSSLFIFDLYLLVVPWWFVIRVEYWEHELLRKILFYYQFTKQDLLDELEFVTSPAVQLQRLKTPEAKDELYLPIDVRFMVDFDLPPTSFDSLAIQIIINESMGNKFPSFVCFLRVRNPNEWQPLKKKIAYADRIIKIQHMVEEDDLHLFVLSKSPKVENPNHTSPREAAKIFLRAHKMMIDFDEEAKKID
ncbi:MAG: hypothetical protein FK733_08685 [Asgard group archaeon]|nr:hypothetical protein [Asgard group archaeon]